MRQQRRRKNPLCRLDLHSTSTASGRHNRLVFRQRLAFVRIKIYKPVKPTDAVNPRWNAENRRCRRISFITRQRSGYSDPTVFYTQSLACSEILRFPSRPYVLHANVFVPSNRRKMQYLYIYATLKTIRFVHDPSGSWKFCRHYIAHESFLFIRYERERIGRNV